MDRAIQPGDVIEVAEKFYKFGIGTLIMHVRGAGAVNVDGWQYVEGHWLVDERPVKWRFADVDVRAARLLRARCRD